MSIRTGMVLSPLKGRDMKGAMSSPHKNALGIVWFGAFWVVTVLMCFCISILGTPFGKSGVDFISKRQRITLRLLYAIGRPSVVCLSVCLSPVCRLWRWCTLLRRLNFSAFFSPYDSSGTLLFWCQKSSVGDAPFPLKFAFKVTHPL